VSLRMWQRHAYSWACMYAVHARWSVYTIAHVRRTCASFSTCL